MLSAFVRFTRPHTIIATAIQVVFLYLIAGGKQLLLPSNLWPILLTLACCLALNVYIVGLNQLTDVELDRINKPWLPLPSGEMTRGAARSIVVVAGIGALLGAWSAGPYLLATVLCIMGIGSIYSLPPLRLKRFSLWAALSIALSRGVIANLGVALHYNAVFGGFPGFSLATLLLISAFFFSFGLVIAIYKDIPDLLGDRLHGIRTFTVQLGPRQAFELGRVILSIGYGGIILVAMFQLDHPEGVLLLAAQVVAMVLFWRVSGRIDPDNKPAISHFYLFLWGLFYAQYLVLGVYQISRGSS